MTGRPAKLPWRRATMMAAAAVPIMLAAAAAAVWPTDEPTAETTVAVAVEMPRPTVTPRLIFPRTAPPPAFVEPAAGPPIVVDDGRPAWQRNAVQVVLAPSRASIAIVIDDMGLDLRRSAAVVSLPAPLTLAYLPYARDLRRQTTAATRAGHELILHVPMEPLDATIDAGPDALRTGHSSLEIIDRLERGLARFDGYVGISNHMGSRFSADRRGMASVLTAVRDRGLLYLDSRTTPNSVAPRLAVQLGVDLVERDIFLDNEPTPEAVRAAIVMLEDRARARGYAVGIGHPRDATIEVLGEWLATAEQRGFQLVPISAVGTLRQANR